MWRHFCDYSYGMTFRKMTWQFVLTSCSIGLGLRPHGEQRQRRQQTQEARRSPNTCRPGRPRTMAGMSALGRSVFWGSATLWRLPAAAWASRDHMGSQRCRLIGCNVAAAVGGGKVAGGHAFVVVGTAFVPPCLYPPLSERQITPL